MIMIWVAESERVRIEQRLSLYLERTWMLFETKLGFCKLEGIGVGILSLQSLN
jgi:hypothetical protein